MSMYFAQGVLTKYTVVLVAVVNSGRSPPKPERSGRKQQGRGILATVGLTNCLTPLVKGLLPTVRPLNRDNQPPLLADCISFGW